jgi:SpoVK/Ycf46/Vps4 family AAA+-type ATPase
MISLCLADAVASSVLFIDKLDNGLSDVASSGQTNSGVSARLFASFLSWLSDHESDVLVVATRNDISRLPPEFARSARFDAICLRRSTGRCPEADHLADVHRRVWARQYAKPVDDDWSGAEIRACCRSANLLDVPLVEATQNVLPAARTAYESVEPLHAWPVGGAFQSISRGCAP